MSISNAQFSAWLAADGRAREILVEAGCNRGGVEVINYLSLFGHHTNGAETPANAAYAARLTGSLKVSRKVAIGATDPTVQIQTGEVEVDNTDAELDTWLTDVWVKRPIRVFLGDPSWPRADFRQIFTGRIGGIQPNGRGGLRLSIYDETVRLQFPVSEQVLGGDGPNKDRLIPLAFGECFNVEPLLADQGLHEYIFHAGAAQAINEVRSIGAPMAAPTALLSTGRFRLTVSPVGQVCADVQGDATGGYANTIAGLVQRLCTAWGDPAHRLTIGEIDADNFAAFGAANPAPVGLYLTDKTTVADACKRLAGSLEASLYFSRGGKLRLFRLPASLGDPVAEYGPGDMDADTPFAVVEVIPVRPAVLVRYALNNTPTKSGLAGGLPESANAILGAEWAEISVSDAAAVALHRYTERPQPEETLLVVESDAQAEAQRRLAQRVTARRVVEFTTYAPAHERELGDVVRIVHPRFGCAGGVDGIVIGIDEDIAAGRVKLEVLL